jgi:hypothetical protein
VFKDWCFSGELWVLGELDALKIEFWGHERATHEESRCKAEFIWTRPVFFAAASAKRRLWMGTHV